MISILPAFFLLLTFQSTPTNIDRSRENLAPEIVAKALWDGRKMVPFRVVDQPRMVKATEADFIEDDEYVLALTIGGESRAYPTRFAWWHHAISDSIQTTRVSITYCSVCNTGIAYELPTGITLDFYGLYNGVVTLCDRETESVFLQVTGEFVSSKLRGKPLKTVPLLDTTWGKWKTLHPDTLVMSPEGEFREIYKKKGEKEPRGYDRFPAPFFKPSVTRGDLRLAPFEKILGVEISSTVRRAYPIRSLEESKGVINDTVGEEEIVVFLDLATTSANAFSRKLEGKTLQFESDANGFLDRETKTYWNIEGKAESGTLAGKTLTRIPNHLSQWYGWVAYHPQTSIYGISAPPLPGNPFEEPTETPRDFRH